MVDTSPRATAEIDDDVGVSTGVWRARMSSSLSAGLLKRSHTRSHVDGNNLSVTHSGVSNFGYVRVWGGTLSITRAIIYTRVYDDDILVGLYITKLSPCQFASELKGVHDYVGAYVIQFRMEIEKLPFAEVKTSVIGVAWMCSERNLIK